MSESKKSNSLVTASNDDWQMINCAMKLNKLEYLFFLLLSPHGIARLPYINGFPLSDRSSDKTRNMRIGIGRSEIKYLRKATSFP